MCRHVAYLGPPVTLAAALLDRQHSLLHQSWAPADMRGGGTVNADGFGIGWLAGAPAEAAGNAGNVGDAGDAGDADQVVARRYRRDLPMWSDACLPGLAASISSGAILAAVRSATVGMPSGAAACAPFVEGAWMFSHNGVIDGWPSSVASLAHQLPPAVLMTLEAPTDSVFLWAMVREHLRAGGSSTAALAAIAASVLGLAPRSRLNMLLNDGQHIAATTVSHSLWLRQDAGGVTISSEPLDPGEPQWQPVPDRCLLEATATHHWIRPLDQGAS